MNPHQAASVDQNNLLSPGSEIDKLLRDGKRFLAIKAYRDAADCDLKTAKQAIAAYVKSEQIAGPYAGSAFTPLGMVVLVVILSVYFYFSR